MTQRKQPFPVSQIAGGLDVSSDPLYIANTASPALQNIWFDKQIIKKGLGRIAFGNSSLNGSVMWIDTFPLYSGLIYYLFASISTLYELITTSMTFTSLHASGSNVVTTLIGPTAWTNGSPGFNTFSSFEANITNAQYTAGTSETAASSSMTLVSGSKYRITLWLVLSSGQTPTLTGTGGVPGTALVNGRNDIDFTATGTSCVLTITNTAVSSWSCSGLGLYRIGNVAAFTGTLDNQFCGVPLLDWQGNNIYAITNGKDNIQKWDGSNKLTDLRGWSDYDIQARQLVYFNEMLIAAYTTESGNVCPARVRWSTVGDVENVIGTGSGFLDLVDTSDWCVALVNLQGNLFVIKERSIWQLIYTGATSGAPVFTPALVIDGIGTDAPNTVVNVGQEILFYGSDDIYTFDGLNATPIGKQIYPLLFETQTRIINASVANRATGTYLEELKQYVISLPPAVGTIPNQIFTYDLDRQEWSYRVKEATAIGFYSIATPPRWLDLTGAWTAQTWPWVTTPLAPGAPTTLFGDSSGFIWEDNRLTYSNDLFQWQTKDFMLASACRWTELRIKAMSSQSSDDVFSVSYSLDKGSTWSAAQTFRLSQNAWIEYVLWINKTSQMIRFSITSSSLDVQILWISPYYIPRIRSSVLQAAES